MLKNLFRRNYLLLLMASTGLMAFANPKGHELTIEINNLKNDKGKIVISFMDGNNQLIQGISAKIIGKKCIIKIPNLPAGKYAFKYFHDENNNKTLDTYWFGAPKEGYGFSNNAKGTFGPPDFEDTTFELKGNNTISCSPIYIKL